MKKKSVTRDQRPRLLSRGPLAVCCVLLLGLIALLLWPKPPPAPGGFRDAEAAEEYERLYEEGMKALPEPTRTVDIPTSFGTARLYLFEKVGADRNYQARTPYLLLPGRNASTPMWAVNLPAFMNDRPTWTIDLIGEPGKSTQTRALRTPFEHAAWLDEALAGVRPSGQWHMVGASFGGWSTMNYARFHADRIASASLLDPPFVFEGMNSTMITSWVKTMLFGQGDAGPELELIEAGEQLFKSTQPVPEVFSEDDLRSIDVPMLVMLGGDSPMHKDASEVEERARELLPHAKVALEDDAGHDVFVSHASESERLVVELAASADR